MLNLSKKTKYGLKALKVLAQAYDDKKPLLIAELAEKERIPKKFLELILLELKNKGLLHSKKGKGGGYLLARSPGDIDLGTVIRILEGPLSPLPCLSQIAYRKCDECEDEQHCAVRLVMKDVREAIVRILEGTSLLDMVNKSKAQESMYFI